MARSTIRQNRNTRRIPIANGIASDRVIIDSLEQAGKKDKDRKRRNQPSSDVEDEDKTSLTKIPGLRYLWIANTKLTDEFVDDLSNIEQLEILKLEGTEISTEGIERLRLKKPILRIDGVKSAGK